MTKRTLIPILLLSSTAALAAPAPDDQVPYELLELRDELVNAGERAALDDMPRYRPLCDAEGYPLVGNVLPKDSDESVFVYMDPTFQPSEFCKQVRADLPDS